MSPSAAAEVRTGLESLLPRMWRYALILTREGDRAADLVQATCVRALEKAHQFQAESHLDRWVFKIMSNGWKNLLRANARFRKAADDVARLNAVRGMDASELGVYTRQVLDGIAALPEAQRSVVVLVCFEQFTYEETADTLEVPIGTVMSRLYHARRALARLNPAPNIEETGP